MPQFDRPLGVCLEWQFNPTAFPRRGVGGKQCLHHCPAVVAGLSRLEVVAHALHKVVEFLRKPVIPKLLGIRRMILRQKP